MDAVIQPRCCVCSATMNEVMGYIPVSSQCETLVNPTDQAAHVPQGLLVPPTAIVSPASSTPGIEYGTRPLDPLPHCGATQLRPKRRRRAGLGLPQENSRRAGLLRGGKLRSATPDDWHKGHSEHPEPVSQLSERRPGSRARAYQPTASWLHKRAPTSCALGMSFRNEFLGGYVFAAAVGRALSL